MPVPLVRDGVVVAVVVEQFLALFDGSDGPDSCIGTKIVEPKIDTARQFLGDTELSKLGCFMQNCTQ